MTFPYRVGSHSLTAEEYISYQEKRLADLEEELAKAMEVVRVAESFKPCICCRHFPDHADDCPIIWLRRHGLK